MRGIRSVVLTMALLFGCQGTCLGQAAPAAVFTVSSPAYEDGGVIPNKFTQESDTAPVSIPFAWKNVPAGTQSFALVLHDVDMALNKGSGDVLHWMAFNIPGAVTSLPEGVPAQALLQDGTIQGRNVGNRLGYAALGGHGGFYHHYLLEFYALDAKLSLGPDATRAQLIAAMDGHVLGKSSYEGRYRRSKP